MSNVFVVIDCKKRKTVLATPSARKAMCVLRKGLKVEIWVDNIHFDTVYCYPQHLVKLNPFTLQEKQYIGRKQKKAEERNKRRKHGK